MLSDLKQKILTGQTSLGQAIPIALPDLRGRVPDSKLLWLSQELQGYDGALDFYQIQDHGLPDYRVVNGSLYRVADDGSITPLEHPYAKRQTFFLSAPISWLEQEANESGDESLVELTEFGTFMSGSDRGVVCSCSKEDLKRIVYSFQIQFVRLLDEN